LNEYLVKGFTMDNARLKQVANIGSDYFDEMLERIRDIVSFPRAAWECSQGALRRESWLML
jgi:hypothetical protein